LRFFLSFRRGEFGDKPEEGLFKPLLTFSSNDEDELKLLLCGFIAIGEVALLLSIDELELRFPADELKLENDAWLRLALLNIGLDVEVNAATEIGNWLALRS
jgi:hypothetical protein